MHEFRRGLKKLGQDLSEAEAAEAFAAIDKVAVEGCSLRCRVSQCVL